MLLLLLAAAGGGWFLNYVALFGVIKGNIHPGASAWFSNVTVDALLFSIASAVALKYLHSDIQPWLIVICIMPVFVIALDLTHRTAVNIAKDSNQTPSPPQDEPNEEP